MNKKHLLLLFALTLIGAILRFYKLDWGQGYFFHPDERNIASAVLNLNPSEGDFNPNFFAYGSFPIYVTYAIGAILSFLTKTNWLEFGKVILIGRTISATLSTLLIPLVYFVIQQLTISNQQLKDKDVKGSELWGTLAATLTVFVPGLIQYAHFSTFEIILTFEYLLALYFALKIAKFGRWRDYLLCSFAIGMSIATKITSFLVAPILPLAWLIGRMGQMRQMGRMFISFGFLILTAFLLSPYNTLDFSSFRGAMDYEGGVATGSLPVFYTAQFIGTTPIWFQLTRVFPYILGWPLTIIGFIAFFFFLSNLRNLSNLLLFLVPTLYFGFHATLFVKWTRYMIPVLPFLVIISVIALSKWYYFRLKNFSNFQFPISNFQKFCKVLFNGWVPKILIIILILTTVVLGLSFFSVYLRPDTRVAAAEWASKNIPRDAKILSEVWDMGIITFNSHFEEITLFNFYELGPEPEPSARYGASSLENPKVDELIQLLTESQYIIVPSQRIYGARLRLPERFPIGARYYQTLFDGTLGFTKIAEFDSGAKRPPRSFDLTSEVKRVWFNEINAEETFKVFDHPKVMIFKKVKLITQTQYLNLLLQ